MDNAQGYAGQDLLDFAHGHCGSHVNLQDHDDAVQEFCLAALQAGAKAEAGRGVKAYQGKSGRGAVLNFLRRESCHVEMKSRNQNQGYRERDKDAVRNASLSDTAENHNGESVELVDTLADSKAVNPLDTIADKDEKEHLHKAIASLPVKLAKVIRLRYFESMTLKQAANVLNCTDENVRLLENKALEAMRHAC